ncbi:nucleotide exchange factor GrpE [Candidatus Regiella endosymbiont of Tuberolachnus salignus]|uniref:nucleotide exchange factor GrpE n=1 Tax=Candidatus Regiella endosymbiont of Tuberolachnus salignus TaxID=3077956 RepID=UPI0030D42D67
MKNDNKKQHPPIDKTVEEKNAPAIEPLTKDSPKDNVAENNAADDPRIATLEAKLAALETELAEALKREKESEPRHQADIANMLRRTQNDIEKAHKFALDKFTTALLPTLDNLEKALETADHANPALAAMIKGVELTLKSFQDTIKKFGIEIIADTNVPLDPNLHQAMALADSEYQPNHVVTVMQKGYKLNGRLLRPAMVTVSKDSKEKT